MSEETKTTEATTEKKLLWANVPWGVLDEEKDEVQITGNVNDRYLNMALSAQLKATEKKLTELEAKVKELTTQLETAKPDTSTSDT